MVFWKKSKKKETFAEEIDRVEGACDVFVFCDDRGRVNSNLKGVLSIGDFDEILMNLQDHRPGFVKAGRYVRSRTGYRMREELRSGLISELEEKAEKETKAKRLSGELHDWERNDVLSDTESDIFDILDSHLEFFEDDERNLGYLLSLSTYYTDNFDKLGIIYRKVEK